LTHGWTRDELRTKIALWKGRDAAPVARLTIRAIGELHDLCVRAAEIEGIEPGEWAARTLERAARQALASAPAAPSRSAGEGMQHVE
jgi:hypothetical protein